MAKMCASRADGLTVRKCAHILPHHFFIAEAGPPVRLALGDELLLGATFGGHEQWLARDCIEVGDLSVSDAGEVLKPGTGCLH